ncbi:MAG: peptidoglycan editing factor PgeF [Pseudomonadota bacterium]
MMSIGWLPAPFAAPPGVCAGVTTRAGGTSVGALGTFNLAAHVGDASACVAENRARLRAALSLPSEPLWLAQVHGIQVHVDDGGKGPTVPCDAAVTAVPGRVLAVLTADCLPVVLVSRDGQRLGVAHAGWRGLVGGVLEATVAAMGGVGDGLLAWLGPAIGPAAFEVGAEVRAAFVSACAGDAVGFVPNPRGRWQADLALLAQRRLARVGVAAVTASGWCTAADPQRFYSHRRDPASGRMATLVWRHD